MNSVRVSVVLAVLMALTTLGGFAARPASRPPGSPPKYILEEIVPKQFAGWRVMPESGNQVVNPQTREMLDKLYSQIVSRTYVNAEGYRIMLSLAYGDEQRGELQAHKPEVCYPAQGYKLHSNEATELSTPFGAIAARHLSTSLGPRKEPITYWFTMGDTAVKGKLQQRLVEIRLGLTGQVPDGLLFRISSIDDSTQRAFKMHEAFVNDLLKSLSVRDRTRLSGLSGPSL